MGIGIVPGEGHPVSIPIPIAIPTPSPSMAAFAPVGVLSVEDSMFNRNVVMVITIAVRFGVKRRTGGFAF
ncbi:hypothetical protein D3OALGA1CA_3038 [Olavius algarvensis associated proteobacterium Delta 3]|nr:hypothetical protein D3OALGA1CA_3038 [Olavius algarvensis associated proteobacterium Delta 3]CAB5157725.1 hypothetical protein D3OALGB2SA_5219 [Olavius algarvensis associated proteobacterium Delta 3]